MKPSTPAWVSQSASLQEGPHEGDGLNKAFFMSVASDEQLVELLGFSQSAKEPPPNETPVDPQGPLSSAIPLLPTTLSTISNDQGGNPQRPSRRRATFAEDTPNTHPVTKDSIPKQWPLIHSTSQPGGWEAITGFSRKGVPDNASALLSNKGPVRLTGVKKALKVVENCRRAAARDISGDRANGESEGMVNEKDKQESPGGSPMFQCSSNSATPSSTQDSVSASTPLQKLNEDKQLEKARLGLSRPFPGGVAGKSHEETSGSTKVVKSESNSICYQHVKPSAQPACQNAKGMKFQEAEVRPSFDKPSSQRSPEGKQIKGAHFNETAEKTETTPPTELSSHPAKEVHAEANDTSPPEVKGHEMATGLVFNNTQTCSEVGGLQPSQANFANQVSLRPVDNPVVDLAGNPLIQRRSSSQTASFLARHLSKVVQSAPTRGICEKIGGKPDDILLEPDKPLSSASLCHHAKKMRSMRLRDLAKTKTNGTSLPPTAIGRNDSGGPPSTGIAETTCLYAEQEACCTTKTQFLQHQTAQHFSEGVYNNLRTSALPKWRRLGFEQETSFWRWQRLQAIAQSSPLKKEETECSRSPAEEDAHAVIKQKMNFADSLDGAHWRPLTDQLMEATRPEADTHIPAHPKTVHNTLRDKQRRCARKNNQESPRALHSQPHPYTRFCCHFPSDIQIRGAAEPPNQTSALPEAPVHRRLLSTSNPCHLRCTCTLSPPCTLASDDSAVNSVQDSSGNRRRFELENRSFTLLAGAPSELCHSVNSEHATLLQKRMGLLLCSSGPPETHNENLQLASGAREPTSYIGLLESPSLSGERSGSSTVDAAYSSAARRRSLRKIFNAFARQASVARMWRKLTADVERMHRSTWSIRLVAIALRFRSRQVARHLALFRLVEAIRSGASLSLRIGLRAVINELNRPPIPTLTNEIPSSAGFKAPLGELQERALLLISRIVQKAYAVEGDRNLARSLTALKLHMTRKHWSERVDQLRGEADALSERWAATTLEAYFSRRHGDVCLAAQIDASDAPVLKHYSSATTPATLGAVATTGCSNGSEKGSGFAVAASAPDRDHENTAHCREAKDDS
ncbi:hypothetical protein Efla_006524 [Eimeria flavescens]